MGVLVKRNTGELNGQFDVGVEIKNAPVGNPKDYVAWVFNKKKHVKGGFELESRTKIPRTLNDTFYVPKRINGRKITKGEMLLLLKVQKDWDGILSGKPEVTLPLLKAYHQHIQRRTWGAKAALGISSSLGLASMIAVPMEPVAVTPALVMIAFASGVVALFAGSAWNDNKIRAHYLPLESVMEMRRSEVPAAFQEIYSYINDEWNIINSQYWEDRKFILGDKIPSSMNCLSPLKVEKYRALYAEYLEKKSLMVSSGNPLSAITHSVGSSDNWKGRFAALSSVKEEWMAWEMDILKVVKYPALFDMREPTTAAFHKELAYTEALTPKESDTYSLSHPFIKATADLGFAWNLAKGEAERISQSKFGSAERSRLSRALDLLRMALDTSGTPAERQSSYKQAMKQLDGLVRIPSRAMGALESGFSLKELEAGG